MKEADSYQSHLFPTAPNTPFPGEQNTESNKKLKEKHYFFVAPSLAASIHMQSEDS